MILEGLFEEEPNLYFTSSGKAVCNFSIDGTRCVAWEDLAENINSHIRVGDKVKIFGNSKERWWTTPEGEKKSIREFTVSRLQVLERPKPIEDCCYYCIHFNVGCMKACYNALGGPSCMRICEIEDGKCMEDLMGEDNKACFGMRV